MQHFEIMDFTGGISTVANPHLIAANECTYIANVDISKGSLEGVSELNPLKVIDGRYFVQYNGLIYSYDTLRSNVIWDNKLYWSDGSSTGKILTDGSELPLGIATPTATPTISAGAAGSLYGTLTYCYTYYDADTGVESAPSLLSNTITVNGTSVVVTLPANVPPVGVESKRIYRVGGYLSRFTLVDTVPVASLSYTDNLDETVIDGRALRTLRTSPPPLGLSFLVELNGRLYGAVGNKVYYASLGNPDSWYTDDWFEVTATITGLASSQSGLLVFTSHTTNILRGTDPANFYMKELSNNIGCYSHFSIAHYQDSVLWLSGDAFVISNGSSISDLTSPKIKDIKGMYPRGALVKNMTYMMSFGPVLTPSTTLYPSTTQFPNGVVSGGLSEGLVVIDFNHGRNYSYSLQEVIGVGNIGIVSNKLLCGTYNSTVAFPVCSTRLEESYFLPVTYLLSDLESTVTPYKTMIYDSPVYIDSTYATLKEYEKVRIVYTGTFNVKVYLDGFGLTVEHSFDDNSSEDGFIIIGIPNSANKGYGISFSIVGEGVIRAIQYTCKPRELV